LGVFVKKSSKAVGHAQLAAIAFSHKNKKAGQMAGFRRE
jgi:hypothetical protein